MSADADMTGCQIKELEDRAEVAATQEVAMLERLNE